MCLDVETEGASVLPGEVSRVHAIVEDVDSSDLTQTQIAESHQQAVPEHSRKNSGRVEHVTFVLRVALKERSQAVIRI